MVQYVDLRCDSEAWQNKLKDAAWRLRAVEQALADKEQQVQHLNALVKEQASRQKVSFPASSSLPCMHIKI